MSLADDVQDAVLRVAVLASRGEAHATAKIDALVARMGRQVSLVLADADFAKIGSSSRRSLAGRLIRECDKVVDAHYDEIAKVSKKAASDMAALQSVALRDALSSALDQRLKIKGTPRAIADDWSLLGADLDSWWARARAETKHKIASELRSASLSGQTPKEVTSRVLGDRDGKELRGGAMAFTRNDASASSRTSQSAITNAAIRKLVGDNRALFGGFVSVATLDKRTSKLCLARHGSKWDMKGKPIAPTSERFPGPPPWHPHCRTILVPMPVGEEPEVLLADEWIEKKGEKFARKLLGDRAYDLWAEDKISTSDLIDQRGRPLSIEELEDEFS